MLKTHRATSLIIAVGVSTLIVFIAIGVFSMFMNTFIATTRIESRDIAYYIAESGIELAMYDISVHAPGYERDPEQTRMDSYSHIGSLNSSNELEVLSTYHSINPVSNAGSNITNRKGGGWWSVKALAEKNPDDNDEYIVPSPGEGTAGKCSDIGDPNAACNWNRLSLANPAVVPLYYYDLVSNIIKNPFNDTTEDDDLVVRIRRPEDAALEVGTLKNDMPPDTYDPPIVHWLFSGVSMGLPPVSLGFLPDDAFFRDGSEIMRNNAENCNTQITANDLNENRNYANGTTTWDDYLSFDLGTHGMTGAEAGRNCEKIGLEIPTVLNSFFLDSTKSSLTALTKKQTLKLTVTAPLKKQSGGYLPHLEYQIVSKKQIVNPLTKLVSEGVVGEYPFEYHYRIETEIHPTTPLSIFDFAFFAK